MNQLVHQGDFVRPNHLQSQLALADYDQSSTCSPPKTWRTPWHDHVDADGILAVRGHFRVILKDDQWMLERFNARWKPISFHRECQSLLRVLREKQRTKGNEHLVGDLRALHGILEAML